MLDCHELGASAWKILISGEEGVHRWMDGSGGLLGADGVWIELSCIIDTVLL